MALAPFLLASLLPAQSSPPASPGSGQSRTPSTAEEKQTEALEAEAGEHDLTYLNPRLVFRYDFRSQAGDTSTNRFRLKSLFSFGPHKRLAIAINIPVLHKNVNGDSAGGLGAVEVQFGGVLYRGRRFRTGAAVEFGFPTATSPLLGGSTTTIKPAWGFTATFSPRFELNAIFNYKRSIYTTSGSPANEFEPDITMNVRALGMTWSGNWDSYYLFATGQFAQTAKVGISRRLDKRGRWVASPYYSFPLNGAGRQTQYIHKAGLDVTWYFAQK
jgi:hypothetical protein